MSLIKGYSMGDSVMMVAFAKAVGASYFDMCPLLTGTGYVGHENGTGNRDIYIGPDNVHQSDPAGCQYLGAAWAWALSPPSTGLQGGW
jgi:hypothetical protein